LFTVTKIKPKIWGLGCVVGGAALVECVPLRYVATSPRRNGPIPLGYLVNLFHCVKGPIPLPYLATSPRHLATSPRHHNFHLTLLHNFPVLALGIRKTHRWMRCLRLGGSIKLQVSFAEYSLFYRALLHNRPVI